MRNADDEIKKRNKEICRLAEEGKSAAEIANNFNLTRSHIYQIMLNSGLPRRREKRRRESRYHYDTY